MICRPRLSFFDYRRQKKEACIRIPAGFMARNGVNYLPEFTSIPGALNAIGRGANQPYFGKQGNILPYSPHEPKRKAIRVFPGVTDITK
jgi:hypothetical protein